jgi:hypothetical protein
MRTMEDELSAERVEDTAGDVVVSVVDLGQCVSRWGGFTSGFTYAEEEQLVQQ